MEKINKAFTLVELIVVITILAILGTIAFLSLQGYSANARDSVRISDIKNIEKGLGVMLVKSGIVPTPDDNKITITASGTTIGYQGYAGKLVQSQLGMSKDSGKDPTDGTYYTYSTNASKTKYEIVGFLEGGLSKNEIIGNSYALTDYSQRTIMLKGDDLGILLSNTGTTLNQPAQENGSISLDLTKTTTGSGYVVQFNNLETSTSILGASSTGTLYSTVYNKRDDLLINKTLASFDDSLVGYWDMESTVMSGSILMLKDLSKYGNHGYGTGGITIGSIDGKIGKATYFNGSSNYGFFINDSNSLRFSDKLSFGALVKINPTDGYLAILVKHWPIILRKDALFEGGKISSFVYDNVGWEPRAYGFIPSDNERVNIFSTYDKSLGILKLYKDGSLVSTSSKSGSLINSNGLLGIGTDPNGIGYGGISFNGIIDEVRIYNRALSDSEIQSLYTATK